MKNNLLLQIVLIFLSLLLIAFGIKGALEIGTDKTNPGVGGYTYHSSKTFGQ